MTAQNTDGVDCLAALSCLFDIIRALKMGSCLTNESKSPLPGSPTSLTGVKSGKNMKKRGFKNSSSLDNKRTEMLQRVPGLTLSNGSSDVASLFTQQGKKGTNQDAMIVWENFGSRTDTVFCGVFDGHGPFGHLVAKRVRDSLPLKLSANWETNIKGKDVLREIIQNGRGSGSLNSESVSVVSIEEDLRSCLEVEEIKKQPEIFQTLKESFIKAFKVMDRELKMSKNIDCFCSGTTAVTLVKQGLDLVIGNIGDSRAILATRDEDNSLIAVQLTVDLKPNLPAEAERIQKCKGRVFALQEEPEVSRVWLPNFDSPGLAMTRAFGDFCLKDFGLISVPEISFRRLSDKDEFIVLATDGIWDVLSNKEVVDIVASSRTRPYAAGKLVESAVRAWRSKYPTSKVDDCAVVCLFLDSTENNLCTASTGEVVNEKDRSDTSGLNRSDIIPSDKSVVGEDNKEEAMEIEETASEYEKVYMEVGKEWSALEGVAHVNTLLTLPRFVPNKDDDKSDTKKRK